MSSRKFIPYIVNQGKVRRYKVRLTGVRHSDELIQNGIANMEKVSPTAISLCPKFEAVEDAWGYFLKNHFLLHDDIIGRKVAKQVQDVIDEKGKSPEFVAVYVKSQRVVMKIDNTLVILPHIDSNSVLAAAAGGALVGAALWSGAGAVIGGIAGGLIGAAANRG